MSGMEPIGGVISAQRPSLSDGLREGLLIALLFGSLMPPGALACELQSAGSARLVNASGSVQAPRAISFAMPFAPPLAFATPHLEPQVFSPTEFRPRKSGPLAGSPATETSVIDAPMQRDTSIAHEMSQFKTQDRVRLLTLWQNRASSLSLQAGKRGAPSLQWSTPWMHRDAASRGLFDRLLSYSPRGFGRASVSHQPGAASPAKPRDLGPPLNNK